MNAIVQIQQSNVPHCCLARHTYVTIQVVVLLPQLPQLLPRAMQLQPLLPPLHLADPTALAVACCSGDAGAAGTAATTEALLPHHLPLLLPV